MAPLPSFLQVYMFLWETFSLENTLLVKIIWFWVKVQFLFHLLLLYLHYVVACCTCTQNCFVQQKNPSRTHCQVIFVVHSTSNNFKVTHMNVQANTCTNTHTMRKRGRQREKRKFMSHKFFGSFFKLTTKKAAILGKGSGKMTKIRFEFFFHVFMLFCWQFVMCCR